MNNQLNIICTSDSEYLPIAKTLLKSIALNSPGVNVYIRLVNCTEKQSSEVASWYTNVTIINDNISLSTYRNKKSRQGNILLQEFLHHGLKKHLTKTRGARWLYSDKMAYCSNIKFATVNTLLQDGIDHLFYIDLDSIVRKDLAPLYDRINSDGLIFKTSKTHEGDRLQERFPGKSIIYHGGMFGIVNTVENKLIFNEMYNTILNDMYSWDADEYVIYDTLNKYNAEVRELPRMYKDEGDYDHIIDDYIFNQSSAIWSGPAHIKYTSQNYVNESKNYNPDI